jgi:hypothetical protein
MKYFIKKVHPVYRTILKHESNKSLIFNQLVPIKLWEFEN